MEKFKFYKKYLQMSSNEFLRNKTFKYIFWGIVFFIAIAIIMGIDFIPQKVEVGQPSPKRFESKKALVYQSEVLTELAKKEAADQVKPVYKVDDSKVNETIAEFDSYFKIIQDTKNSISGEEEKRKELKKELNLDLNDKTLDALINTDNNTITEIQQEARESIRKTLNQGIKEEEVTPVKKSILNTVSLSNTNNEFTVLVKAIIENITIEDNLIYDPETTEKLKQIAMENVQPVKVDIKPSQEIVRKGVVVTEFQYEQLEKLGLLKAEKPYVVIFGLTILIAIIFAIFLLYMYLYKKNIFYNQKLLLLLALLIFSCLLITKAFLTINLGDRLEFSMLSSYMVPLAAWSMMIAILFDIELAIFTTLILGIFAGVMSGSQLQLVIIAITSGIVGIFSVSQLSQRSDLAKASIYITLSNIITIIALGLMFNHTFVMLAFGILLGIINGILSSVLTIGFLPFWETAFGITTPIKLLELSNPNQPLLRRLLMEAPGTYHHSILVGNLAEAAAEEVGADSLLARVGAYYHDIGKIKRPYFFIENQLTTENPHDKLAPSLSHLIITSHVKDGVEMAKENKLPQSVIDIIHQHHGNSLLSFFYMKAVENSKDENNVSEDDFRYDNPIPMTKEAAIVMLADGVEAGVRSMQKPTPNRIEAFVKKIIKDRLDSHLLEECNLTFKELDSITHAFVTVLNGIFHSRIEYPEKILKEIERGKGCNGNCNRKQISSNGNQS